MDLLNRPQLLLCCLWTDRQHRYVCENSSWE